MRSEKWELKVNAYFKMYFLLNQSTAINTEILLILPLWLMLTFASGFEVPHGFLKH